MLDGGEFGAILVPGEEAALDQRLPFMLMLPASAASDSSAAADAAARLDHRLQSARVLVIGEPAHSLLSPWCSTYALPGSAWKIASVNLAAGDAASSRVWAVALEPAPILSAFLSAKWHHHVDPNENEK